MSKAVVHIILCPARDACHAAILDCAFDDDEIGRQVGANRESHEPVAVAAVVLCTVSASAMPPASGGGEAMITGKETHEAPTLAGGEQG